MTHNNPPNSFFNNSDADDDAETNIDVPPGMQSPQAPFNPYAPYNQPPNYGQPGPISGNLPPVNPQMRPGPQEPPKQPNYGQPSPYNQPPNYGQPYPPNIGYGPDYSQEITNLGSAQPPYPQPPNYGPQGGYKQPPTHLPPHQNWQDGSETRLDTSEQPQIVQPLGLLIVKRPLERRGYAHHVRGAVTIGRRAGNILLATDDLVSEYHTSIRLGDPIDGEPAFWIVDMNSRNGTKVNGVKIEGRMRLQNGDEIGIGRSIFVFMMLKD